MSIIVTPKGEWVEIRDDADERAELFTWDEADELYAKLGTVLWEHDRAERGDDDISHSAVIERAREWNDRGERTDQGL